MDSVPKLLPIWHDIALQDFVRQKSNIKFASYKSPDHGGVGMDININASVHCSTPKYFKAQIKFASDKCALPFFPLKKTCNLTDPCLEDITKEKQEYDKFCMTLTSVRERISNKKIASNLKRVQHEISSYHTGKQDKEFSIQVPKSLVHLSETIPKHINFPKFNVTYAGGVLATCESSGRHMLLHPKSENLTKLCITPLLDGNEQCFLPEFSEQVVVNLKKEPLLQIEPALEGYCCVRQKSSYHLVNMTNRNYFSKGSHNVDLYHIATSLYNPMEVLSVYNKGVMKLRNMETRNTLWHISSDVYDKFLHPYATWRCGFGSHPFSAFCLNEKNLYCFDLREKKYSAKEIFNIKTPSFHVNEELVGMKLWNKNPFQHFLTSSHHLILCDERYPKTPVMCWNHCLKDPPLYLEYADFDSDVSIIVIGSQGTQELASFLCSHQGEIQPVSLNPPLLLSSPTDCIKSLKFHSHFVDDQITTRFSSPITGVGILPNNREIGYTVLQLTSLGDIFYQDFKQSSEVTEKTYCVGTGCVLTPPQKILPHFSELMSKTCTVGKVRDIDESLTRIKINIDKFLSSPKEVSANCMLCRLSSTSDEKELVLSEICPMCNLSSVQSQHFAKALTNKSVIIGPAASESNFLDCDLDYLSSFEDEYSKRFLSVWLESDDIKECPDSDEGDMSYL